MSSIDQYINLYRDNAAVINSKSAPLLNSLRQQALASLEGKRLPDTHDEGFEKTSVEKMFAPDFGVNINRINIPTEIARSFRCDVPNVSTLLGVVVNDSFVPSSTLIKNIPEGVTVMSLAEAANKMPEAIEQFYGRIAPLANPAVALNTLLIQDGVLIKINKGVKLDHPIQIVNIFNSTAPLMGVRRVLIIAEKNSSAAVLFCDHTQADDTDFLSSEIIEANIGENARLDICAIEESSARTSRYSQMYTRQETGSTLRINSTTLLNGTTRNEFSIDINGENATTLLSGMVTADREMHVDNYSNVNHLAPHCYSNQLFKYLLDDKATGAFEGGIYVSPDAPFTEGYQSNRNIVASADARMHTKPQLLIYNDDVKCSHGATIGQLDRDALFYMQTRGIPETTARRLLMQAFMTDALDTIAVEGIRSRLAMLVEKRLSGETTLCGECVRDCHNNQEAEN